MANPNISSGEVRRSRHAHDIDFVISQVSAFARDARNLIPPHGLVFIPAGAQHGQKLLSDLFHDVLKAVYFAEKKILTSLPKMAKPHSRRT